MLYQRIVELDQPLNEPIPAQSTRIENHVRDNTSFSQRERQDNARKKEDSESEAEDEIYQFRRVHVVHKYRGISLLQRAAAALAGDSLSGSMTQPPPSNDGRSETSIVDDPLNIWSDMKRPPVEFRAAITYINKVKVNPLSERGSHISLQPDPIFILGSLEPLYRRSSRYI